MPLQTTQQIKQYIRPGNKLALDPAKDYDIEELTGGTANWVYRISCPALKQTSILKHAEPFVRQVPTVKFSSDRMDHEAGVLRALLTVLPKDEVVNPVEVLAYDQEAKLLHLSDGGTTTLKDMYMTSSGFDAAVAGACLGKWLVGLHECTQTLHLKEGDNATAKGIYRHAYNHVAGALDQHGFDKAIGERVDEEFGSMLRSDDENICHGDFWTGNVLVKLDPMRLTIVDWEMARRGNGATDVGQFAAESWLLDRFRGEKGLLTPFLEAYRAGKDESWDPQYLVRQRVAIHFGTHISYWPTRVAWGDQGETHEVIRIGSETLEHALDKDYRWFKKGPLAPLFQ